MLVVDDEEIAFLHVPECLLVVLVVTNTSVDREVLRSRIFQHFYLLRFAVNETSELVNLFVIDEVDHADLVVDVHQLVVFVDARVGNDEAIEVF